MTPDRDAGDQLSVYQDRQRLGTLFRTDPLSFTYDAAWLAAPNTTPLHPQLPLTRERLASPAVFAFFENLLPEGDERKILTLRHQVSSVFGLLAKVGGDTAGSVVILPEGELPQPALYQSLSWEQVNALLHADHATLRERDAIEQAAAGMPAPRLSLSGAQAKMLLSLDAQGQPLRPMGSAPSTHILKPDIVRTDLKLFASSVNETIVMRAAHLCGLPVAQVSYQATVKACLVKRYDRVPRPDGSLARLWQADFCQIAGLPSDVKYETDGGPSFQDCFDILADSSAPAVDRRNLLRWLFFNLYVGNNDSHAKNLALLATADGLRLAPFYDLMSMRVYSGLSPHFAFAIGGERDPGRIGAAEVTGLAQALKVNPAFMQRLAAEMAGQVERALPQAVADIRPALGPTERVMAERLEQHILSLVRKGSKRILA